jgi:hypothetical protein
MPGFVQCLSVSSLKPHYTLVARDTLFRTTITAAITTMTTTPRPTIPPMKAAEGAPEEPSSVPALFVSADAISAAAPATVHLGQGIHVAMEVAPTLVE